MSETHNKYTAVSTNMETRDVIRDLAEKSGMSMCDVVEAMAAKTTVSDLVVTTNIVDFPKAEFEVTSDVPLPGGTTFDEQRYPFHIMKVGDSFFVKGKAAGKTARNRAYHYAHTHKNEGIKFTSRELKEKGALGVRIWRAK